MPSNRAASPIRSTTIDLGAVTLTVAVDAGPRILGYARPGGPQLFADLPDTMIVHPLIGEYRFLGGHRLWRAPEDPAVTYLRDDHGVAIRTLDAGVELSGPPDPDGVSKQLVVRQSGAATIVDHVLRNDGAASVVVAPWAITQLAPGGTAFLPQPIGNADPDGVLPNRHLVLWPYADPGAPEVTMRQDLIEVFASDRPSRFKAGWPNRRGWLCYELDGELFVKWARRHDDQLAFTDLGASAECYRDERFLELETLGPLATLAPGGEARHREVWTLIDLGDASASNVIAALPVEPPEMAT